MVGRPGAHTLVSTSTKLALLDCFGLPARSQALARESLDRLMEETQARPPAALGHPFARRAAARAVAQRSRPAARPDRISCDAGGRLDRLRVDARRRRAPPDAAERARDRRAPFRPACAADRPPPARSRRRDLRADHRAAGGLSAEGGVEAPLRRLRAALRAAARAGRSGHRRFHRARRSPPPRRPRRAPPISASAPCTCCFPATAAAPAPIIPPTGVSSIPSSSTR